MRHPTATARPYHHGNLAEALVSETIATIAEIGIENFSLREVAKRLGVSPAAPFRHFPTKSALLTAVAEEGVAALHQEIRSHIARKSGADALDRLIAAGHGYLAWTRKYPTHFRIANAHRDHASAQSETLVTFGREMHQLLLSLLIEARAANLLRPDADLDQLVLGCRALVYGLARMVTDGHFDHWSGETPLPAMLDQTMENFVSQLRRGA